jgi:hypothetical protein
VRRDLTAGTVRGEPGRIDAAWRRTLLPPVGAVVGIGLFASILLGDAAVRSAVLSALAAGGEASLAVLYWPVLLVGLAAEWLVYALRALRGAGSGSAIEPPPRPQPSELLSRLGDAPSEPASWLGVVPWAIAAGACALALYTYWLTSRRRSAGDGVSPTSRPHREALGTWDLLLDDLRLLLGRLLARLRPRGVLASLAGMPLLASAHRRRAPDAIDDPRAAYRQLLAIGRSQALARRAAQTPDEYLSVWQASLPGGVEASELTGAYREDRYGPDGAATDRPAASTLRSLLAQLRRAVETAPR